MASVTYTEFIRHKNYISLSLNHLKRSLAMHMVCVFTSQLMTVPNYTDCWRRHVHADNSLWFAKARCSLFVLKVPLNSRQSISDLLVAIRGSHGTGENGNTAVNAVITVGWARFHSNVVGW